MRHLQNPVFIILFAVLLFASGPVLVAGQQPAKPNAPGVSTIEVSNPASQQSPGTGTSGGGLGGGTGGGDGGSGGGGGAGEALTVIGLLGRLRGILNSLLPFIVGLTIFVILWGIFIYISHAAEEEKRREARQFMLYGIIGVFLMLSIWGFINILVNTFNLQKTIDGETIPHVPAFELGAG